MGNREVSELPPRLRLGEQNVAEVDVGMEQIDAVYYASAAGSGEIAASAASFELASAEAIEQVLRGWVADLMHVEVLADAVVQSMRQVLDYYLVDV